MNLVFTNSEAVHFPERDPTHWSTLTCMFEINVDAPGGYPRQLPLRRHMPFRASCRNNDQSAAPQKATDAATAE